MTSGRRTGPVCAAVLCFQLGAANAGAQPLSIQATSDRLRAAIHIGPDTDVVMDNGAGRVVMGDSSPVNTSRNPGLAPTYLGRSSYHNRGAVRLDTAHVQIDGYTRGWDAGTCLLAVLANAPPGTSACNQGGFWDPNYRWVYPGQDSAAAFFGINGITPVGRDIAVDRFGTELLSNPAGGLQAVGSVVLRSPLNAVQIQAVNEAAGPMRIQVNNGFFAYVLPTGFTRNGTAVTPASSDGRTVLVDNWVRAVEPGNSGGRGQAGATATLPSLPYWTASGEAPGTGMLPGQVGATNGSPPLAEYSVTIDGNYLAEAQYGGFKITDGDVVNDARYLEMVGVNNKTGTPVWSETQPTDDSLGGHPMMTHLIYGGCQNDDDKGLGVCGAMMVGSTGLKRIVVCSNPQTTAAEGGTDCVLDTGSTFGWKSTKASGYVLWIDPVAAGKPRMVVDWNGNVNTQGRVFVGTEAVGVIIEPDGSATATSTIRSGGDVVAKSLLVPGAFRRAELPHCSAQTLGAHVFVADARKPGESGGHGSGVPADCVPRRIGATPVWLSVYDQAEVSQ